MGDVPNKQQSEILRSRKIQLLEHYSRSGSALHGHEFLELTYITRGSVRHTLDGRSSVLSEGDYLIVDYGSRHSYLATEPDGYDNIDCLFLPELIDPVLRGTKSLRSLLEHYLLHFRVPALVKNPTQTVFHDDGTVLRLLRDLHRELLEQNAGYREFARCYLLEILLFTMRQICDAQAAAVGTDVTARLTEYVREHYMEPIELQTLSRDLGYSLPYLSKKFRDDVGVSFVVYLQNFRVNEGCRLLSETDKTLTQITEQVGYRDVKFFSALVKRYTGLLPRDFRRKYRETR